MSLFTRTSAVAALAATILACAWRDVGAGATDAIRIGLFLPGSGEDGAVAMAIERGARIAAEDVNAAAGSRTPRLELVSRRADVAWAAGARQIVALTYEDDVAVILGGSGGREAHLAEQVLTRTAGRVVFITFATDPTLTQVRLPWVFRMVPDDRGQADALGQLLQTRANGLQPAMFVEEGDYDAALMAERLDRTIAPPPSRIRFADTERGREHAVSAFIGGRFGAAVLLARPRAAGRLAAELSHRTGGVRLLGPSRLACSEFLMAAGRSAEGAWMVAPATADAPASRSARAGLHARYRHLHGGDAPPLALAAYDAIHVVASASGLARNGRQSLRSAMASAERAGASGVVRFDGAGNRRGAPVLLVVRGGALEPLN